MMVKLSGLAVSATLLAFAAHAQMVPNQSAAWQKLIDQGKKEEARALCSGWLKSDEVSQKVEAYKCLANVELSGEDVLSLQGNDAGGGTLGSTYKPEAADKAIADLNEGLKLAPQDLSIHQGRLHILEVTGRYADMAKALDESCAIYKGADGLDAWIAYTEELFEAGQYRGDLGLLKVLEKHYPDSHLVLGNFGAVFSLLKEDDQAEDYLKRAVKLAPTDPIDNWNLARLYDFTGKTELADEQYQKAIPLETEPARLRDEKCMYAKFVETKLHDPNRACPLEKASCEPKDQTACNKPANEK
jgi:tetratricopeptide (TPR) repeat protein